MQLIIVNTLNLAGFKIQSESNLFQIILENFKGFD